MVERWRARTPAVPVAIINVPALTSRRVVCALPESDAQRRDGNDDECAAEQLEPREIDLAVQPHEQHADARDDDGQHEVPVPGGHQPQRRLAMLTAICATVAIVMRCSSPPGTPDGRGAVPRVARIDATKAVTPSSNTIGAASGT